MTGADLIKWIQENDAENLDVYVYDYDGCITNASETRIEDQYGFMID